MKRTSRFILRDARAHTPAISNRFRLPLLAISVALSLIGQSAQAQTATWSGGAGNWSTNSWNGSAYPNAIGATAIFNTGGTTVAVQDVILGITLGTIQYTGGSGGRTIQATNAITFNNNSGDALIENATTSTSGTLSFGGAGAGITLADNLTIRNMNSNLGGVASISFSTGSGAVVHGTGDITFSNVSNNVASGQIQVNGSSDFTGNVLIQKGAVTFGASTAFGNSANTITLGSAGNGSATLMHNVTGAHTLANNIIVAAGTGGTLVLGNNTANTGLTTFSGNITLNGDVSLNSNKASNDVRYTGVISGAGSVATVGTSLTRFGNGTASITNTYTGNTTLTETSSFVLSDNAKLTFDINASGVNNKISGTANQTLTLDGDFIFDLSGADGTGSWTIVDVGTLNETFGGTFSVIGFSEESANVWKKTIGETTYTFTETDGILTAVPEPSTYALLALGGVLVFFCRRLRSRSVQ
jgi:hypothetical protein